MRTYVRMTCIVEFCEMRGDHRSMWTPSCLTCGWVGSDNTRLEAEREGAMHERGEVQPWIAQPGQPRWEGDPRSRPAD
jgi:hypothetical protein